MKILLYITLSILIVGASIGVVDDLMPTKQELIPVAKMILKTMNY